ncbi:hypothetical protein Drose_06505 [Dactylosporangium roseum]|uniref:Uncharacterized protein n=1 Tax=Dactylosporangium roseum TaxID=47989 RepID=A0ABY5Z8E7_9ACTN|nr:hypothetical protein [Dactylosporangium roseum]UWZ37924.1 hypothetical protein Drose_06505 [Dactylosporangium roseum]
MTGDNVKVVAAVSSTAALPLPQLLEPTTPIEGNCPACGGAYVPLAQDGSQPAGVCYPPTVDYPVPGHEMPIPAWCATRQAHVWRNADGVLESDRPCVGCRDTGRIAFGSAEDGTPPAWRPCPACCPTPADVKAHEEAVAKYGEDYF